MQALQTAEHRLEVRLAAAEQSLGAKVAHVAVSTSSTARAWVLPFAGMVSELARHRGWLCVSSWPYAAVLKGGTLLCVQCLC